MTRSVLLVWALQDALSWAGVRPLVVMGSESGSLSSMTVGWLFGGFDLDRLLGLEGCEVISTIGVGRDLAVGVPAWCLGVASIPSLACTSTSIPIP